MTTTVGIDLAQIDQLIAESSSLSWDVDDPVQLRAFRRWIARGGEHALPFLYYLLGVMTEEEEVTLDLVRLQKFFGLPTGPIEEPDEHRMLLWKLLRLYDAQWITRQNEGDTFSMNRLIMILGRYWVPDQRDKAGFAPVELHVMRGDNGLYRQCSTLAHFDR